LVVLAARTFRGSIRCSNSCDRLSKRHRWISNNRSFGAYTK
jgi:hypothetical protein